MDERANTEAHAGTLELDKCAMVREKCGRTRANRIQKMPARKAAGEDVTNLLKVSVILGGPPKDTLIRGGGVCFADLNRVTFAAGNARREILRRARATSRPATEGTASEITGPKCTDGGERARKQDGRRVRASGGSERKADRRPGWKETRG